MKKFLMAFLAVVLSTAFGLLIAEVVFRLALPPVPGDEFSAVEYLAASQRNPGAPRLFPAGYTAVFDIRGLYRGADKVTFHIGPNRFIDPEPKQRGRYNVLFLGGSVTEGIYLHDYERWPARLGADGDVATYNAGMSAAGMLNQYVTAKYLAERGDKFDLVVLATNHNDSAWSRRFQELNYRYDAAHFAEGTRAVFEKEFFAERKKESPFALRTLAWARHWLKVAQVSAWRPESSSAQGKPGAKAPSLVVEALLVLQDRKQNLPRAKVEACRDTDDAPGKVTQLAFDDWKANLPAFRQEMKRLFGAELLVVSEPTTYGAPSESFYYTDLRVPVTCMTNDGPRALTAEDSVEVMRQRAHHYIEAGRLAGAHTFDLAEAMSPYSNGPDGGAYFFDSMHPTPKGAEKMAELLRPAMIEALKGGQKE